jgi:hypothetical protein
VEVDSFECRGVLEGPLVRLELEEEEGEEEEVGGEV